MKLNWKVRFKNKVWLTCFFSAILTFIYTILGMFDIYPEITKNDIGEIINSMLMFLSLTGVIVDPTTAGVNDSNRAMGYEVPYSDELTPTEEHASEPVGELFPGEDVLDADPLAVTEVKIEENVDTEEPES